MFLGPSWICCADWAMTFFAAETTEIRERSIHGLRHPNVPPILDYTGAPPKMIYSCIFGGPTIVCWCCCGDQPIVVFLLGIITDPSDPQVQVFAGIYGWSSPNMDNYCDFINDQIACTMVKPPIEYDLTDLTIDDLKHSTLGRHN
jgi:hypothetical protein